MQLVREEPGFGPNQHGFASRALNTPHVTHMNCSSCVTIRLPSPNRFERPLVFTSVTLLSCITLCGIKKVF